MLAKRQTSTVLTFSNWQGNATLRLKNKQTQRTLSRQRHTNTTHTLKNRLTTTTHTRTDIQPQRTQEQTYNHNAHKNRHTNTMHTRTDIQPQRTQEQTYKQRMCTPELELISVSLRPRYLPREFGRIFVTVVYAAVYDSTSAARAGKAIAAAVRDLQLISADAPCFIVGDFNHCDLHKALPSFRQFVTCPTRVKNTIDLCYGNIPRAYKSVSLPPVGKSDHNSIHLIPAYRPKIETDPIVKKSVKVWTPESEEQLRGCFECTEWSVLVDLSENVSEAADVVSSYIGFCEDMLISTKIVKVFPNNKRWISKSIKSTLNEKKDSFSDRGQGREEESAGKIDEGIEGGEKGV